MRTLPAIHLLPLIVLLFSVAILALHSGCDQAPEQSKPDAPTAAAPAAQSAQPTDAATPPAADGPPPSPPQPPLTETFDGEPRLSLFPRVAGARPGSDDPEGLAYWKTFIEHLQKTSGVARGGGPDGSNCWMFRGNTGLPSLGFFSPLAVEPDRTYRITFDFRGEMPAAGEAGVGVLEFREFLWVATQFDEEQLDQHLLRAQKGTTLTGKQEWGTHHFEFTTTPQTEMIHLILFREGEQTREPVFFDNILIEPLTETQQAPEQQR